MVGEEGDEEKCFSSGHCPFMKNVKWKYEEFHTYTLGH